MAFVFDADPGSATMNSYASVEFADDYFFAHFNGRDAWNELDEEVKQALLVSATNVLETFTYGGLKTNRLQPLKWPRSSIYDDEGNVYSNQSVPIPIQKAQCELAYWMLDEQNRTLPDVALQQFDSFKAGPLAVTIKAGAKVFPDEVIALLHSTGVGTLISTGNTGKATSMTMAL